MELVNHIKLLNIEPGGLHAELGLGISGGAGVRVRVAADVINDMAVELLASGANLAEAGAPAGALTVQSVRKVLGCTRLAVSTGPNGEAVLMLAFGAHVLCANVTTSEVRQALDLLNTAAAGGLMPPPKATQ